MAIPLRQSTASQEIPLGPFVDSLDGNTAETGLTIANTDIKIWRTGATTLADKTSGGATHISGGIYYAVLDATDTATLGPLIVTVHVAGALPVRVECMVMSANAYDSMIAGTDTLDVEVASIATAAVGTIWTTALTEAYAADNVAFTGAQALFMIHSNVGEFSISGTTLTTKKLDGSTTAMVYTIDDATNPTSRTRSS